MPTSPTPTSTNSTCLTSTSPAPCCKRRQPLPVRPHRSRPQQRQPVWCQLTDATVSGADLTGATLERRLGRIASGGLIGTPVNLPTNWELLDGYLIGPFAYLSNAGLTGANLADLDLQPQPVLRQPVQRRISQAPI